MQTRIKQSLISGVVATFVMTIIMFVAPMMEMPKMNPPAMLSEIMGFLLLLAGSCILWLG